MKTIIYDERVKLVYGPPGFDRSLFLKEAMSYLSSKKIPSTHIVHLDLKEHPVSDWRSLNRRVKSQVKDAKKHFFIIDGIDEIASFSRGLKSLLDNYLCSVIVTGQDTSYLLSEIRRLKGREWVPIFLNTLSFQEYLQLKGPIKKGEDPLRYFETYMSGGGLPDLLLGSKLDPVSFFKSVINEELCKRHPKMDFALAIKTSREILKNTGCPFSETDVARGLSKKKQSLNKTTVRRYASYLEELSVTDKLPILSEEKDVYSKGGFAYMATDAAFVAASGVGDIALSLKTILRNYFVEEGYEVSMLKTYKGVVDFHIEKDGGSAFIEVVSSFKDLSEEEKTKMKSLFKSIKSSAPRYIISLDLADISFHGVKLVNAVDVLLGKEEIHCF